LIIVRKTVYLAHNSTAAGEPLSVCCIGGERDTSIVSTAA